MAYREPSAPPGATTRLEYGPYPLDWRPLLVALLPLGGAVMFGAGGELLRAVAEDLRRERLPDAARGFSGPHRG